MLNLDGIVNMYARGTVPGGFHMNPEYYAGRPPSSSDIATASLEGIYKGLQSERNQHAATNFVRMVNLLEDLSASAFIVALRRFWTADCDEIRIPQPEEDHVGNAAGAFHVLATRLTEGRMDSATIRTRSEQLKRDFIRNHLSEIPSDERQRS